MNNVDILKYMLGANDYPEKDWGWRNYYYASSQSTEYALLQELISKELVVESSKENNCFHATKKGCLLVGVSDERINKLFPNPAPAVLPKRRMMAFA